MSDTEAIPALQSDEPPADADLPGQLAAAAPRRWGNRATPVLLVLALMAGAFLGGVQVQRKWGATASSSSSSTSAGARFPGRGASSFPRGGFPGGGASGGPGFPRDSASAGPGGGDETATVGTIKTLTATEMTIETSAGTTVVVKIADSTTISRMTTVADLKTGQSITVRGPAGPDGTVTATAVTAS
jgi:hypothetical protein